MLKIWERMEQDRKVLLEISQRAAAERNPIGLYDMGIRCLYGWDVKVNVPEALKYFQLAAKFGHAGACYELAKLYLHGDNGAGILKDIEQAEKYITYGLEHCSPKFNTTTYKHTETVGKLESMKAALDYLKTHPMPSP